VQPKSIHRRQAVKTTRKTHPGEAPHVNARASAEHQSTHKNRVPLSARPTVSRPQNNYK
jgi:hypothetical protein